jgi:hypothetical protein
MYAIPLVLVHLAETVANYSVGMVMIAAGASGSVVAARLLLTSPAGYSAPRRALAVSRHGSESMALAIVLVLGLVSVYFGMNLWTR